MLGIGGNAAKVLAGTFSAGLDGFAPNAPKGDGALLDIGGSAAKVLAGAFSAGLMPPNGVGALVGIGGRAAKVLAGACSAGLGVFAPPKGDGALLDIGGRAAKVLAGAFPAGLMPPNGVGALLGIGGSAAKVLLLAETFLVGVAASDLNENPLAGADAFVSSEVTLLVVPNLKPPLDEVEVVLDFPPKEKPPAPIAEVLVPVVVLPPKEKPPAPMEADDPESTLAALSTVTTSAPGREVSHATH